MGESIKSREAELEAIKENYQKAHGDVAAEQKEFEAKEVEAEAKLAAIDPVKNKDTPRCRAGMADTGLENIDPNAVLVVAPGGAEQKGPDVVAGGGAEDKDAAEAVADDALVTAGGIYQKQWVIVSFCLQVVCFSFPELEGT